MAVSQSHLSNINTPASCAGHRVTYQYINTPASCAVTQSHLSIHQYTSFMCCVSESPINTSIHQLHVLCQSHLSIHQYTSFMCCVSQSHLSIHQYTSFMWVTYQYINKPASCESPINTSINQLHVSHLSIHQYTSFMWVTYQYINTPASCAVWQSHLSIHQYTSFMWVTYQYINTPASCESPINTSIHQLHASAAAGDSWHAQKSPHRLRPPANLIMRSLNSDWLSMFLPLIRWRKTFQQYYSSVFIIIV